MLGPTDKFPRGKVHKYDEGELRLAVATDYQKGVVVIDFGGQVTWLALEKDKAMEFANLILKHAASLPTA